MSRSLYGCPDCGEETMTGVGCNACGSCCCDGTDCLKAGITRAENDLAEARETAWLAVGFIRAAGYIDVAATYEATSPWLSEAE